MQTRPCWVEIDTHALEENFRFLRSLAPRDAELTAVLKSNAYGHSLELCAPVVARAGARWIALTSVEEAVTARGLCPELRIMVLGGVFPGQCEAVVEHRLTPAVWESFQIDELAAAARAAGLRPASFPVHLEIDSGMSRQGANLEHLAPLLARFTPDSPLKLEGVMTHLFASDETDGRATESQLEYMRQALHRVGEAGHYADWLNIGSSPAVLGGVSGELADLAAHHGMKLMLRPGLALYGVVPRFIPEEREPASAASARAALKPILTWKTRVAGTRSIPAGAAIGYNGTFIASEPMRVALLPAGYADGLTRSLGNRFSLLVRGERAPLVGRVSMDHAVLDVTEIPGVESGDEVVILGTQGEETVSAYDHADAAGTIPWEIFTRIGPRVRRTAV